MIQNYQTLQFHIEEYNKGLRSDQGFPFGQIQKAFSTSHLLCLLVRYPGKTRYLYIGRGQGYEGFWEGESPPPSNLRIRDRFLEYIRKHIVGSKLGEIYHDAEDRVLYLPLKGKDRAGLFSLFWRGRESLFTYAENSKGRVECFSSWKKGIQKFGKESSLEKVIENELQEAGKRPLEQKGKKKEQSLTFIHKYLEEQAEKRLQNPGSKRKRKYFERKIGNIEKDLEKVSRFEKIREVIQTEGFKFSDSHQEKIAGMKFKFPFQSTYYQKRDLVYSKIKAFRKAQGFLQERLTAVREELNKWENGQNEGEQESIGMKVCGPVWATYSQRQEKVSPQSEREKYEEFKIKISSGQEIVGAIGKNTLANDWLRSKWAHKNDLWFHLEGMKSGHCILKLDDLAKLSEEDFSFVGSLIRDFAKVEFTEISLVFTQVKNLKGVKGQPGAVLYKKARFRKVSYRNNWRAIISLN